MKLANIELYNLLYYKSSLKTCLCSPDKRELLKAAKANAMKILGVEKLELPESVKPLLSEQLESKWVAPPEVRVRQDPERTLSQVGLLRVNVSFTRNTSHTTDQAWL